MAYRDLSPNDKLVAVHTDFMRHPVFCILGGVTQVGKVEVRDDIPTACTTGADVMYGTAFIKDLTRKQLRYLVGHENLHKALHHCTEYVTVAKKYPREFAQAIDYVVNWQLESMDTEKDKFLERLTNVPPLVDPKFADMSVLEVMRELLKDPRPNQKPMDEHEMRTLEPTDAEIKEAEEIKVKIEDAVRHGEIVQGQMRSATGAGSASLSGFRESRTDWKPYLRRFFQEMCEGDDQSRFNPPNKRMLPLDIILPSHFSESTGEIIIACDTSGSMHGYYGLVFGEVARICQTVLPKSVRLLWWDTRIAGEQVFTQKDYAKIAKAMAPKGGGGTTVSCVAAHIREKKYKPKAVILLSDGYIESQYEVPTGNVLWGIVNNARFVPLRGKVLHIQED
ncbi:vWFA domain containing protein [uncultured Caudovirales phage]|uniref:VWFA domain containing protein n=1 Tax=uncultured Caudovirales phage TaxID=2100421 RepID=A0A6J7WR02_9CAUD|nr:vWFA domain containing protein [uncultured Caudovirales phage]CAB5219142.1 vWFA domain containing protein [uncultured Caudovirales phage]